MKKLLCAAFAVLVLAGCSGGAKTETKTCSLEESGMKMDATFTAEDDKITKTSVKVTMDLSAAGLGDKELTDDQKKQLETAVLSQLGVEEGKGDVYKRQASHILRRTTAPSVDTIAFQSKIGRAHV